MLTNLLFMPFMSGAAYNGDMATVTFGFSAQSDESRHMTLGLEIIKFMLEQDEGNVPIVQKWIDKWFWRGYRLLCLVAMMMDYMLPRSSCPGAKPGRCTSSRTGGALFEDLSRYGIRTPKHWEVTVKEKSRLSHEVWSVFYNYDHAAAFHSWDSPDEHEMHWLAEKYPATRSTSTTGRASSIGSRSPTKAGVRTTTRCRCSARPARSPWVHRAGRSHHDLLPQSDYKGTKYHFCSDGCKDIFDDEPEKYVQAWLPVHQIYQGHCGGASVPEVLEWYHLKDGQDNKDYRDSQDRENWLKWKRLSEEAERTLKAAANA